ncbi:unnamed protein product [Leptidea sinapis]|nr:unnamed protein product [Leptidea sinapis]
MLQTQLAKNLFKMGQFGEDLGILSSPESIELPLSLAGVCVGSAGGGALRLRSKCRCSASAGRRCSCWVCADGAPEFLCRKLQEYQQRVVRSLKGLCDEERALSLVLQLPALRSFTATFVEDVFFVGFIGDVSIDDIIPYMLNAER